MPILVLSQPVNALAFVLDGVIFGASAFIQSCHLVAVAAIPALACMGVAVSCSSANWSLLWVWIGLLALMAARAMAIWWSLKTAYGPFAWMSDSPRTDQGLAPA
jgi:hypothetical protein